MGSALDRKDPSWINILLLISTFLNLSLVMVTAYRGWKEDRALHYSEPYQIFILYLITGENRDADEEALKQVLSSFEYLGVR